MSYQDILSRHPNNSPFGTKEKYTPYKSQSSHNTPPKRTEKKSEWSYVHYAVIAVVLLVILIVLAWCFWSSPTKIPKEPEQCDESILDVMKKQRPIERNSNREHRRKLREMETECSSTSLEYSRNDF